MMNNAEAFKIDPTAKDNDGRTGFQLAKPKSFHNPFIPLTSGVVNLIKSKMPSIAVSD